jgi:hypothetical protein
MDLGKIGEKAKSLWEALNKKAGPLADKILAPIPAEKRRLTLVCLGAVLVLFICIILIMLIKGPGRTETGDAPGLVEFAIPPEELFFPGEPDFVPSLLPERDPRQFWTEDDVRPFWRNPGDIGREEWRREMGAVIDELMESVP